MIERFRSHVAPIEIVGSFREAILLGPLLAKYSNGSHSTEQFENTPRHHRIGFNQCLSPDVRHPGNKTHNHERGCQEQQRNRAHLPGNNEKQCHEHANITDADDSRAEPQ